MEVIFVDNHILVVSKPAGLSTQTHGHMPSLEEEAKQWIKKKYNKPGAVFLQPIHRLDKSVSGLVLFARTSKALTRLQEQMRTLQIKKTYFAYVEGIPEPKEAALEHFLIHDAFRARISPEGKSARLSYRTLSTENNTSFLEIELHTGRYHQIRAQLAAIGHPILGDAKYGSTRTHHPGIALHHGLLEFLHPVLKTPTKFQSDYAHVSL